jgi:hypothetical protein
MQMVDVVCMGRGRTAFGFGIFDHRSRDGMPSLILAKENTYVRIFVLMALTSVGLGFGSGVD